MRFSVGMNSDDKNIRRYEFGWKKKRTRKVV